MTRPAPTKATHTLAAPPDDSYTEVAPLGRVDVAMQCIASIVGRELGPSPKPYSVFTLVVSVQESDDIDQPNMLLRKPVSLEPPHEATTSLPPPSTYSATKVLCAELRLILPFSCSGMKTTSGGGLLPRLEISVDKLENVVVGECPMALRRF